MSPSPITAVRRIAIATTAATYLLVVIGGMVRATGSGLGCGNDWPRCNGRIVPLADYHTLIEFSHRFMATVVVIGTIALAVAAIRFARNRPGIVVPAVLTVPLVLSQAVLGAVVVNTDLQAESVVAHLLVAMSLLALLIVITVRSSTPPGETTRSPFATSAAAVAGGVLALLLVGSYVSGRGAGLAYRSWPWFDPTAPGTAHHLHALHRVLAVVMGVAVGWLARKARSSGQLPVVQRLSRGALHLFLVQIVVGAANVWSRLHPVVATAHLALGAAIWAAVFSTAYLARGAARSRVVIEPPTTVGSPWRPSP
jgi:heme A synthase